MVHAGRFAGGVVGLHAVAPGAATFVQQRPVQNFAATPTPTNFYKEFEAHFSDNDVPSGSIVEWRQTNGTTVIPSQHDNYRRWPSGSLRSVAVTVLNASSLVNLVPTTWKGYSKIGSFNNASWASTSVITAKDIRAEINIGGTTYTLGANNEVARGNLIQVRSGALNATWRVWGEFRNGTASGDTIEGDVWGIMYLTFFSDGSLEADCRIYSSRGNDTSAPSKAVISYQLKDYVVPTVFSNYSTPFTFFGGRFIDCVDSDGAPGYTGTSVDKTIVGFPDPVLANSTTTGLYDAMMMWWIQWSAAEVTAINAITFATINYTPQTIGETSGGTDATGAHWWVGHMTARAIQAMATKTYATMRQDRINALAEGANPYWFLNILTSYPWNLDNTTWPGLGVKSTSIAWGVGTKTITITGGNVANTVGTTDHAPMWAWYQWLSTGKEKWLDQLHGNVIGQIGYADAGTGQTYTRNPTFPGQTPSQFYASRGSDQTRGFAWGELRNKDNVEWATPDTHLMKPYLVNILTGTTGQFAVFNARLSPPYFDASATTLGFDLGAEDAAQDPNINAVNSPWMHDYKAQQACMSVRRGRISTSHLLIEYCVKRFCVGRGVNGCIGSAASYQMNFGTPYSKGGVFTTPPFAQTWDQVGIGNLVDTWGATGSLTTTVTVPIGGTVLTFASVPAALVTGLSVVEPNIPTNAIISLITPTTVTISQAATGVACGRVTAVTSAQTLTGSPVLTFASVPATVVIGMPVAYGATPANLSSTAKVLSFTPTTVTLTSNALGTIASGGTITFGNYVTFHGWDGPITNVEGLGCPVSGLSSTNSPYDAGASGYQNIFHAMAVCADTIGIAGASTIVTYMAAVEAAAGLTESSWAVAPNARIRKPS